MVALTRRLVVYLASFVVLLAVYTLMYQWGMAVLEGESRTWHQALEIVVQSMTTTGYGQDAPWETLEMTVLVMLIQVTGIAYIAVAIPQFVIPWLQQMVEPTPPTETDALTDHVVIVGYTASCEQLVDELMANGTPHLIIEHDPERAQSLHESSLTVLHRDPTTTDGLEAARLDEARAVVVDATERDVLRATLTIETSTPTVPVFAFVGELSLARYFRYAGVDEVLLPKHRLGKALGDRVRAVVTLTVDDRDAFEEAYDVLEYHVDPESELFGETVASMRRLEQTGATVLGAWVRGDFVTVLSEHVRVDENTTLVVVGTESEQAAVAERTGTQGTQYRETGGRVVVAGRGLVGATTRGTLERAGVETTVIDTDPAAQSDVVGDATEEAVLIEAGIRDAQAFLVALESDAETILATLTARALNPAVRIIAGAETTANVNALRTAGASDVLALPSVAGRMIMLRVFEHETMRLGDRVVIEQVAVPSRSGTELSRARIQRETGCAVVALEREGTFYSDPDGMVLESDDSLILSGTDRQLEVVREVYGQRRERTDGDSDGAQ
ncbi:potassium channel family protein [Natrialba hulunbeirensis]|uniref:potassium channel family protein n=1 Tax=Natrialba hulunbeirensis TaxID=123783 RepID=UPI00067787B0|nr:NAD-binding protein [Natrialba hulunbeirensis]